MLHVVSPMSTRTTPQGLGFILLKAGGFITVLNAVPPAACPACSACPCLMTCDNKPGLVAPQTAWASFEPGIVAFCTLCQLLNLRFLLHSLGQRCPKPDRQHGKFAIAAHACLWAMQGAER